MPISNEHYQKVLETRTPAAAFSVDQFRSALKHKELAGVLTDETNPEAVSVLTTLAEQAKLHGLEISDLDHTLQEISEQLDIEANSVARHEHEADRKGTSLLNIPHIVAVRWNSMLETFGKGVIAKRADEQRKQRLSDKDYIAQVTAAAIERASLRKRFQEYIAIGGSDFSQRLQEYMHGSVTRESVEKSKQFGDGVDAIVQQIDLPKPFEIDGVEIEATPENLAMIRNHLRFVISDEVIQLAQLSQMRVMETDVYHVTAKRDGGKMGTLLSKVLGSGTLWGMTIRGGSRAIGIGGSIVGASFAASPVGWSVLAAAVGTGAVAGYVSQWAQYKFVRRQQKKMDLATGALRETVAITDHDETGEKIGERQVEVVKSAEQINHQLKAEVDKISNLVTALQDGGLTDYTPLEEAITAAYRIMMDAECRLLQSKPTEDNAEKQDLISFGMTNRLQAGLDLVKNLKQAALVVRDAKQIVKRKRYGDFSSSAQLEEQLRNIAVASRQEISAVKENLERALLKGEGKRRIMSAVVGGSFAGLSSVAMDYFHHWFGEHDVSPAQAPSFEHQQTVTVHQAGAEYTVSAVDQHQLMVQAADGQQELITLPDGVETNHIVIDDQFQLYQAATGEPVAAIHLEFATAETLKVPELAVSLDVDHYAPIDIQGHQFGMVVNQDGNLALYQMKLDGTVDLSQPVGHTPMQIFSEPLHQKFSALAQTDPTQATELIKAASKLNVETQPDGTVLVKSVYDQSIVAQFKIETSGVVTVPEPTTTPVSGDVISKLFADPNSEVAQALNKMGVQAGEVSVDAQGHLQIPDAAVRGEYLGQTAGWRQMRLTLLLEAYQSGKISGTEPADVVVARLERATRHLLMESGKYHDPQSALNEAFGKPADFIAKNELPFVNGAKSNIGGQWGELVDTMRRVSVDHPAVEQAAAVGDPATAIAEANLMPDALVNVHPITPEQLFEHAADLQASTAATEAVHQAWSQVAEQSANLVLGIVGGALDSSLSASHLIGRRQSDQIEHGTQLPPFVFSPEFSGGDDEEDLSVPAKAEPTKVEVAHDASVDYDAVVAVLRPEVTQSEYMYRWLKRDYWDNDKMSTTDEVKLITQCNEILKLVQINIGNTDQAILEAKVIGRDPDQLIKYLNEASIEAIRKKNEIDQHAAQRANKKMDAAQAQLNGLNGLGHVIDVGVLQVRINSMQAIDRELQDVANNVSVVMAFPGTVEARLRSVRGELASAQARIGERIRAIEQEQRNLEQFERMLTETFKSAEFSKALLAEFRTLGLGLPEQGAGVVMLNNNFKRLVRQQPYLNDLLIAGKPVLSAISVDLADPATVRTLATHIQAAVGRAEANPNIIQLANIPERLQWQINDKLDTIVRGFGLGKKFGTQLAAHLNAKLSAQDAQVAALAWFNEQWNRVLQKDAALNTASTEQKLKRLNCFDAADRWDDAKVAQLFDRIMAKDQTLFADSPAPDSIATRLNKRLGDPDF